MSVETSIHTCPSRLTARTRPDLSPWHEIGLSVGTVYQTETLLKLVNGSYKFLVIRSEAGLLLTDDAVFVQCRNDA